VNVILFLFTLNLVLLSRLVLTFKDEGTSARTILKMAALPAVYPGKFCCLAGYW